MSGEKNHALLASARLVGQLVLFAKGCLATSIALATFVAAPASSRACSRYPSFQTLHEPSFDVSEYVVESTKLELACAPRGRDAACTLEARYRVRNRGSATASSHGRIAAVGLVPTASLESGGVAIPVALVHTKFEARRPHPVDWYARSDDAHTRAFAFDVVLDAGEGRDLVVRSAFVIDKIVALVGGAGDCNVAEGVQHRHPIVAVGRSAGDFDFRYVPAANPGVDRSSRIALVAQHPREWRTKLYRNGDPLPATTHDNGGDLREEVDAAFGAEDEEISIGMDVEKSVVFNGGPFLGAMWSFAPGGGPRLRVGYEIAAPAWLIESVSLESDLVRQLTLVPAVEAVTSTPIVFGLGLGIPVRLRPDAQIGVRIQLDASYRVITLRGAFDVYPGTALLPHSFEGSIGPQVSF